MLNKLDSHSFLTACFLLSLSSPAVSSIINEVEPNNPITPSFIETAYNIDPYFSSEFNADIGDISGNNISDNSSHVSINGTGDGSFDYYSFTITSAGLTGIFDIDYGSGSGGSVDTEISLWNDKGTVLRINDDYSSTAGAGGSTSSLDSFMQYDFLEAGIYIIGVAEYNSNAGTTGWTGNVLDQLDTYTLHVALGTGFSTTPSTPIPNVPVPPALYLFLSGILSIVGFGKYQKNILKKITS